MSYKVYTDDTNFDAEDANNLEKQKVSIFVNAAERDNAIPSPIPGQHVHLLSEKRTYYWDVTAGWVELLPGVVSGATARPLLVTTSTTRPAQAAGRMIFETDTKRTYISDGTTWIQKQPTQIAVKNQFYGNIPVGNSVMTVTLPSGKSMPSANYVVNATAHELLNDWGGAIFTTLEAVSISATTFKVRVNNGYSTILGCHIDYVLTEVTA